MASDKIIPHKITKPIQLLGAWLVGLSIINGSFLGAAASISHPDWAAGTLVIASIVNVPVFLFSIFLLQTKFRPEMQEDSYYSEHLARRYSSSTDESGNNAHKPSLEKIAESIITTVSQNKNSNTPKRQQAVLEILKESELEYLRKKFSENRSLSEIYLYPNLWAELVSEWGDNEEFIKQCKLLVTTGLISYPVDKLNQVQLTKLGEKVAKSIEAEGKLWNQNNERHMTDWKDK